MASVIEFAEQIPALCCVEDPERWAVAIRAVYDEEKKNGKLSAFRRTEKDKEQPGRRLRVVFGFTAFNHDVGRASHCYNLLRLWELAHYRDEHGEIGTEKEIATLLTLAEEDEQKYPDIAAVLSAKTASEDGGW